MIPKYIREAWGLINRKTKMKEIAVEEVRYTIRGGETSLNFV
jgi:hypothetical protein